jgi:flagellum-specific ATP synthase
MARSLSGAAKPIREGFVTQAVGMVYETTLGGVAMGDACEIRPHAGGKAAPAEVIGLHQTGAVLMPLGHTAGVTIGDFVRATAKQSQISAGPELLGRVINALGEPLDGKPLGFVSDKTPLHAQPPPPLERGPVNRAFATGVKVIDGALTLAEGMRIGIFAGAGVGKSTLLGMALRHSAADVNIVSLIGERGREVTEFVEDVLGKEGMARSVVVVSTSDTAPLERVRAAFVSVALAEYFQRSGKRVLLVMDSLTRLAMAQREIGLSVGEPPMTKGYTPSVFSLLPKILERVCPLRNGGSITGLFTVLVEGDDLSDPVADSARSLLDGHVVLSRDLAARGHYPAVDVLASISRVMNQSVTEPHRLAAESLRQLLATAKDAEELQSLGAYSPGKVPRFDRALAALPAVQRFLRQGMNGHQAFAQTVRELCELPRSEA